MEQIIRVLQITDSLKAAGRERMAVNMANLLQSNGCQSYLCTTRTDGPLENQVDAGVGRLRLARNSTFEVSALFRLVAFIREKKIQILHAHGRSLFIAGMASLFPPYPYVVWHDNDGKHGLGEKARWLFRLGAKRVDGVITATRELAEWTKSQLGVPAERVWYLPNYVQSADKVKELPDLPGKKENRIVCLAGLRPQKDHITLLRAMALVVQKAPNAQLLIVGGVSDDIYLEQIHSEVANLDLHHHVSFLGERKDVYAILQACQIGVLSSASEAFPLALLEYGRVGIPSVATRVGECEEILDEGRAGILVNPQKPDQLASALLELLQSPERCVDFGLKFKTRVQEKYGEQSILKQVKEIYSKVLGAQKVED